MLPFRLFGGRRKTPFVFLGLRLEPFLFAFIFLLFVFALGLLVPSPLVHRVMAQPHLLENLRKIVLEMVIIRIIPTVGPELAALAAQDQTQMRVGDLILVGEQTAAPRPVDLAPGRLMMLAQRLLLEPQAILIPVEHEPDLITLRTIIPVLVGKQRLTQFRLDRHTTSPRLHDQRLGQQQRPMRGITLDLERVAVLEQCRHITGIAQLDGHRNQRQHLQLPGGQRLEPDGDVSPTPTALDRDPHALGNPPRTLREGGQHLVPARPVIRNFDLMGLRMLQLKHQLLRRVRLMSLRLMRLPRLPGSGFHLSDTPWRFWFGRLR